MSGQLKQKYLLANSPNPPNFEAQRQQEFEKLIVLISNTERAKWLSTGFSCGTLVQSYKQVYGLTSQQFETLLMLLINIAFKEEGLSTDVKAYILRLLNTISQFQIKITSNFKISNQKLLFCLKELAKEGMEGALKHSDAVIEDLSKFILYFSRFGEEVIVEALDLAIESNDIRYLVIFLRSIQSQSAALRLLTELFSDNNLWDRDCSWFYILGEIIKKFPTLDYSSYYQTIMQEVIRAFTTIINGDNEQSIKKLTSSEPYLQIQPVLKSAALILAYLILPACEPQHVFIKSCIERLFSLIRSSLDYVNPPDYLNDLLSFAKAFVRYYLVRYRTQRGLFKLFNEDWIDDVHEPKNENLMIDQSTESFFDSLWADIIPKIVFLEDPEECKPSKIIAQLCMYKPEVFLQLALESVLNVVNREDPTLVSFHGAKITILFLQEFVILDQPSFLSPFFDCTVKMLGHLERLGIADNLDLIELFCRNFIYLSERQLNEYYIQSTIEDTLALLLENLDSMSIGLEDSQDEQAQLYLDMANIYFPLFLRLQSAQIAEFSEKFIYKLVNTVPEHKGAYQMITICLTFIDQTFPSKLFKHFKHKLIAQDTSLAQVQDSEWQFLSPVKYTLHVTNDNVLKWYASLLQCIFQYHPLNVVHYWSDIEALIVVLIKEWDNQSYLQIALDILYNAVLCLCKPHLSWKEFSKDTNGDYRTLQLKFEPITAEIRDLIDHIFDKFFASIRKYLEGIYSSELEKEEWNLSVVGDFQNYIQQTQNNDIIRVRKRNLKLVEFILMPSLSRPEDSYDKKIIYRALSVQYTVLSALMFRVPFHPTLPNIGDFLTEPRYSQLRTQTCKYLEWVLQLFGRFSLLGDEQCVKLFNYFWRQSHDEVCFTSALQSTNEKISPYYYPQMHKKKQILRSPFLVVNEAYLTHMARMEFHLIAAPTAHLNNNRYLESNFILGLSPSYEPNLHSFFPNYVQVHLYHRELIAICRYHLNIANPDSYLSKYLKQEDPATKERYTSAIRCLILSFKRLLNVFSDSCCMKDEFVRNTIFETVSLYKLLPKKNEKSLIYELIYVMLVFSFDANCCEQSDEYSLKRYWQLKLQGNPQTADWQVANTKKTVNIQNILNRIEQQQLLAINQIDLNRDLRLTRSCSYQNDSEMQKQLQRAIIYLLGKIQQNLNNLEKDFNVNLLMLLLYSNSLHLKHPLISKIILLLTKLSQSTYSEVFEMSKVGFFHMVNRFNYNQRQRVEVPNTPVRRPWEQFLRYKYIGAQQVDYESLKIQKNEQNFYPTNTLVFYRYRKLASDPSADTYNNEKTLLQVFSDEEGMFNFLKNCSLDPDLKQTDQNDFSLVVSEQNFKSVSAGAHKLMHFIWDSNPTKTPLFMGLLERYAASPLNFYNRLFRKIIRIGNGKTEEICLSLTERLRQSEEQEMIRLSFYISCQLLMMRPSASYHQSFLDYLGVCTKENFDYVLMGFYGIFTANFLIAQNCYKMVLEKLRSLKGAPRLRHLELSNTYMIAQGRFARKAAIEMSSLIMRGIEEGSDEISEAIVSMITQCFVQAVNLKNLEQWVEEPLQELVQTQKIYLLNEFVGYNRENFLIQLLVQLMKRAREEEVTVQALKLRIYSQIVRKILASIAIFRFNDYFYKLLREIIIYVMERPQSAADDDSADIYVITQLCDSQYPEEIYRDLLEQLLPMSDRTPYVIKKKLLFLQNMVINRSFRLNKVDVPPLLATNEKQLTLDYIITVSTIYRLMKNAELTAEAEVLLKNLQDRKKYETYALLAILMAAGSREFEWKEAILRDLIKNKKDKLIKAGISDWWRGKAPETEQQYRIHALVRNFDNPYSYFA